MASPTLKPLSIKPVVSTLHQVKMKCIARQAVNMPVKLLGKTKNSQGQEIEALHDCMREVTTVVLESVGNQESHPRARLELQTLAGSSFVPGATYVLKVEKDE